MANEFAAGAVAGWYPDPDAPQTSRRFWDGSAWTEQRAPASVREQRRRLANASRSTGLALALIALLFDLFRGPFVYFGLVLAAAAVLCGIVSLMRAGAVRHESRGVAIAGILTAVLAIAGGVVELALR